MPGRGSASVGFIILTGAILTVSVPAVQAQQLCRTYEYAELRDMRQEKLQEMYCDYDATMRVALKSALAEAERMRMGPSKILQADANRCAQELDRFDRVLDSKYGVKKTSCAAPK